MAGFKFQGLVLLNEALFICEETERMDIGHFYFLADQYFADFPDNRLMSNKEMVNALPHDRPCFCAFQGSKPGVFWMIPISSQLKKFKRIYQGKVDKRGRCDTIDFGYVLGREKAFLLQNMCPVTDKYIKNEYLDPLHHAPVRLDGAFEKQLIQKASKVLALQRKGVHLIFPDVLEIEKALLVI